jgi:hypothetical protein
MTDSAPTTPLQEAQEEFQTCCWTYCRLMGTSMGNQAAREALSRAVERQIAEEEYEAVK